MKSSTRYKVKVFASHGALTVEAEETTARQPTVAIDAAAAGAPGRYDWGQCIRVRLTYSELVDCLTVLLGWATLVRFSHHGEDRRTGFALVHRGSHVLVSVYSALKGRRQVPVGGADLFRLSQLCLHQLHLNHPWQPLDALLMVLKATAGRTARFAQSRAEDKPTASHPAPAAAGHLHPNAGP